MAGLIAAQVEVEVTKAWGELRPTNRDWPPRLRRALQDLDLWLHDEDLRYIQLDHHGLGLGAGFVEDATELTIFILTERFAVLVILPRPDQSSLEPHQRYQVPRKDLTELTTTLPPLDARFEGLRFEATYRGFPRPVVIEPSSNYSGMPDLAVETELFVELRDDLFTDD